MPVKMCVCVSVCINNHITLLLLNCYTHNPPSSLVAHFVSPPQTPPTHFYYYYCQLLRHATSHRVEYAQQHKQTLHNTKKKIRLNRTLVLHYRVKDHCWSGRKVGKLFFFSRNSDDVLPSIFIHLHDTIYFYVCERVCVFLATLCHFLFKKKVCFLSRLVFHFY